MSAIVMSDVPYWYALTDTVELVQLFADGALGVPISP